MEEILEQLPFSDDIADALLKREGPLADYLVFAERYERGRWVDVAETAEKLAIDEAVIPKLYMEACEWANSVSSEA